MTGFVVRTPDDWMRFAHFVSAMEYPYRLTATKGVRTLSQNAIFHKWVGEIAAQTHCTADQVKRECKFYQGCPILMAENPEFVAFIGNLRHLTTEEKIAAMDYVAVTSVMDTKQMAKMCDAVQAKYLPQGIVLTNPEAGK